MLERFMLCEVFGTGNQNLQGFTPESTSIIVQNKHEHKHEFYVWNFIKISSAGKEFPYLY